MRLTTLCSAVSTLLGFVTGATAAPVTFSGTISYQGSYSGDTLFVAVIDTVGDVTFMDLKALPVGPSPLSQPYSAGFDNAGVSPFVLVAAFLDTDGGGLDSVGGADIFGWYGEGTAPAWISSAASQSGLDFALPRAEIHGTVTFAPAQTEALVDISEDLTCSTAGFRPEAPVVDTGPYSIIGIYPGTYCVSAEGFGMSAWRRVCYGDPYCATPAAITLTATEIRTGVDLDFSTLAVESESWGRVKASYR